MEENEQPNFPGYGTIEVGCDGAIATITLDRPERLNALNLSMIEEMIDALDRIEAEDGVRAAIITGAGRAFCAGADLEEGGSTFERGARSFSMREDADGGGRLARRLYAASKPLIAAINGPAVGIGITMTLPMDIRLIAADARVGFVFTRRGLVPEACSSFFLPRIVGISQALEWIYSGRLIGAEEAAAGGLVRSVHPGEELLSVARSLATEMTENSSPVAIAISRRLVWQMLAGDPRTAHERDSEALHFLGASADVREGVNAFLEKRPPAFPMRVSTDLPPFYARWAADPVVGDLDSDSSEAG